MVKEAHYERARWEKHWKLEDVLGGGDHPLTYTHTYVRKRVLTLQVGGFKQRTARYAVNWPGKKSYSKHWLVVE